MKCKCHIASRKVYKWKARLNVHGGKQEYGINYWETYSPVVHWFSIRLVLILSILNGWSTCQIDFVMAYPQAPIKCDMYMDIPKGFEFQGDHRSHVLCLKKNLYGQKQAGQVWNEYLKKGLLKCGFKQSSVDESVFYKGKIIFLLYVDDGIFATPTDNDIDGVIKQLQELGYDIEVLGTLSEYLGVQVHHLEDGRLHLSQPHLIQQIIDDIGFNACTRPKSTPVLIHRILHQDPDGEAHDDSTWHYRSVIGKLNFLEKSTRPDIAYAVHQCARFLENPKVSHAQAVKILIRYLMGTKDKGIILNPRDHSFDCWADADFSGNWHHDTAQVDPSTAKSRSGYLVTYAGCPILWASKLQTEIALSTTKAEYITLSQSLREVIPLIHLMSEIKQQGMNIYSKEPKVFCKAFEDNSGALEIAKLPKMRPQTKHMNVKYHHFREHVCSGVIKLFAVGTEDQIADALTKPLPMETFLKHRLSIMGW